MMQRTLGKRQPQVVLSLLLLLVWKVGCYGRTAKPGQREWRVKRQMLGPCRDS